jgi:hypothetical protein
VTGWLAACGGDGITYAERDRGQFDRSVENHTMSGVPFHSLSGDPRKPYAPQSSDALKGAGVRVDEAEMLRRANAAQESYVHGLGIANFIYSVLFGLEALYLASVAFRHLEGTISAAWIFRPIYLIALGLAAGLSVLALSSAVGFLLLRRWAFLTEFSLIIGWFSLWLIHLAFDSERRSPGTVVMEATLLLAFAMPMLNIADLWRSILFDDEYSRAIQSTPAFTVSPRLPRDLTLIMLALFLLGGVMAYMTA